MKSLPPTSPPPGAAVTLSPAAPQRESGCALGAALLGGQQCRFNVWAPRANRIDLFLPGPPERLVPMTRTGNDYFELIADGVGAGTRYFYRIDGDRDRPDPASRFQPDGVHCASAVVDPAFAWTDQEWRGIRLEEYVIYEVHVGVFTPEGTFDAVIDHLADLKHLGITALELMPVAQFPGTRNWGYDGVHPFAVQNSYGGPDGLRRLVNAAHDNGMAVVLDVVYNHLGPEGCYLQEFGNYYTDHYRTPWGDALNFDGRDSDEVRRFFIENALYWIEDFHIDALRLDAVHSIFDFSARPFLRELADSVRRLGERLNRRVYTIAESSLNDPRLIAPAEQGGSAIDAQWSDDFHHALRTALTGERSGYYADYLGFEDLEKAWKDGFVLDGRYSHFYGRRHGDAARHIAPARLIVCSQNHDQVGNRLLGDRLTQHVNLEALKLTAATVILSPYTPLLFMGEEYGETAPFRFFISHTDPELVEAVRAGRRKEFTAFGWEEDPPDAQDEGSFLISKLRHSLQEQGDHQSLKEFYRRLISLRRTLPAMISQCRDRMEITSGASHHVLNVRRWAVGGHEMVTLFHFGEQPAFVEHCLPAGTWEKILDSAESTWSGPGSSIDTAIDAEEPVSLPLPGHSVVVFQSLPGLLTYDQ